MKRNNLIDRLAVILTRMVEDLVQIITVFSCKLQGKRAKRTKQMIKELIEDDTVIKN